LAKLTLSHVDRAIAFLWFYRQTQEFEERTAKELASDLHDEAFPNPNVTRLKDDLSKSKFTVNGKRKGSFQIDVRRLPELDTSYLPLLKIRNVKVSESIIPGDWVQGSRRYIEQLVRQINGAYDYEFYDGCAALCRRLMESLIIDVYIASGRAHEIQDNGVFFGLERLISTIRADRNITLGRNVPKTMDETKQLGDTAAHDRVYITPRQDIDDLKARYRRMIRELLDLAKIKK
jgi:hypothetical protein